MSKQYEPGQPLIDFSKATPRLAWVSRGYGFGCMTWEETHWLVTITHDQNDVAYGRHVSVAKVKPYTDELWAACQDWIQRRTQLGIEYEVLKRGKQSGRISPAVAPWQASLLEVAA